MNWDEGDFYDIACGVGRSRRYHSAMRDFYRRIADFITAITAISGTSAFVAIFLVNRAAWPAQVLTFVIAAASTLNLVYGFGKKADLHDKLTREFTKLAGEIELWPPDAQHLAKARSRRVNIEVDEPHVRRLIDLRAQNDEWRARGIPYERFAPLTDRQKSWWLAYFMDWGLDKLEARHQANRAARQSAG